MATATEPTLAEASPTSMASPLDDSLKKFLAGPKKLTDPDVVAYDPGAPADPTAISTFRPSISDVASDTVTLNQDPGLGYTQAEQWAHEQAVAEQALAEQKNAEQLALQQQQFDLDKRQTDWDYTQKILTDTQAMQERNNAQWAAAAAANNANLKRAPDTRLQFTQLPSNYTPSGNTYRSVGW